MSYTFRVLFSGLCAFVPNKPFEQLQDPPDEVTVLLRNLLRPDLLTNEVALEPHFPLVQFDLADLHPQSPRRPDLRREETGKAACFLFGEEIVFDLSLPKGTARKLKTPTELEKQPRVGQTESTPQDRESLYWLAKLEKASPNHFVDPEVLTTALSLAGEPPIIARLKLDHGFFRVSRLSEQVCHFEPSSGNDRYEQQIATELALDIEGVEGPVLILLRAPDGTERTLMLSPVRRSGLVEIRIQNRELDDFLGIPKGLLPPREVADFEVFYDLVQVPDGVDAVVRRFPRQPPPPPGPILSNPSLCPPSGLALKPPVAA